MPKLARELSATEVRRKTRPGVHAVGGVSGLLLNVAAGGSRSWILRTMVGGRRRDIGLGGFPDVTLKDARTRAREAKDQIRKGIDPVAERKAARAALMTDRAKELTFAEAARQCHAAKAAGFGNPKHRKDWISSLERYAFPDLGKLPIGDIELPHVLKVLEPMWTERTETATRVRQRIEAVITWATVSGYRTGENPARWAGNLKEVLPPPSKLARVNHFAALPWQDVPAFLVDLKQREGMGARALEFIIYTAARSAEVRLATRDEIDLKARLWTIPAERMKAGKAHRVPLSPAAVALLKALPVFHDSPYLFTAPRGGPLSDMSINSVTRRMKVPAVPHGFRSSFKDWSRTSTSYADEVSELALAHVNSDATRAAYARDELLPQRGRLMNEWARFLGKPARAGSVTSIRGRKRG